MRLMKGFLSATIDNLEPIIRDGTGVRVKLSNGSLPSDNDIIENCRTIFFIVGRLICGAMKLVVILQPL